MDAARLKKELERRGLTVLGIGQFRARPEVLAVYLHGLDGQWVDGYARRLIRRVPGVVNAVDSVHSPAIVLVLVEVGDDGGIGDGAAERRNASAHTYIEGSRGSVVGADDCPGPASAPEGPHDNGPPEEGVRPATVPEPERSVDEVRAWLARLGA